MKIPTLLAALSLSVSTVFASGEKLLFDFQKNADVAGWAIEDDGVMGGLSKGRFRLTPEGHGEFSGDVSLENNGGFSSLQWNFDPIDAQGFSRFVIRVRGDGKRYLLLTEAAPGDRHYYQAEFQTNGDWQTLEIPFADMVPHFRGDRLDQPNFPGKTLAQVRFMIANKKAESFRLEIDQVGLR
jgi:NADH dehydrogenase [ubiquinone] 1 alpha subcomplex assembly factor 1